MIDRDIIKQDIVYCDGGGVHRHKPKETKERF